MIEIKLNRNTSNVYFYMGTFNLKKKKTLNAERIHLYIDVNNDKSIWTIAQE